MSSLQASYFNTQCCLIWEPYKNLQSRVEAAVLREDPASLEGISNLLRQNFVNFNSLLSPPGKSPRHREIVSKGDSEGFKTSARSTDNIKVDSEFVRDALKLSDVLDLDELRAAELITRSEIQLAAFPGMPRLPLAAMLYFDGQFALATALSQITRAGGGRSWLGSIKPQARQQLDEALRNIMVREDLFGSLLARLRNFDPMNVKRNLEAHGLLAIPALHQRTLLKTIQAIEDTICETIFYWCAQQCVTTPQALNLYKLLGAKCQLTAKSFLNKPSALLLTAMLNVLDLHCLQDGVPNNVSLSLVDHPDIAERLLDALRPTSDIEFRQPEVKSILQFALTVAVNAYQLAPPRGQTPGVIQTVLEDQERLMDDALQMNVFQHMVDLIGHRQSVVHTEHYLMLSWHNLITDFIVQQPLKLQKIRMIADEVGRTSMCYQNEHGVNPPSASHNFELLLEFVSLLYRGPDNKVPEFAHILIEEFWTQEIRGHTVRVSPRLVALFNFVVLFKEYNQLLPVNMYVPYCKMLATICQSPRAAATCFKILSNQLGPLTVSLEHIFIILHTLHQKLRNDGPMGQNPQISPMEVNGLIAAQELLAAMCRSSESARVTLAEHPVYNSIMLYVSLLGCSLPTSLKAACLDVLTAFTITPENALKVWQYIEAAKLVPATAYVNVNPQPGMQMDLEEVESRNGLYPVTIAFLRLLDTLTDSPLPIIVGNSVFKNGFDPYMNYLRESVFLKFLNRNYKDSSERWIIGSLSLRIMEKILRKFSCVSDNVLFNDSATLVLKPTSENGAQLAYNLLAHLLQNGPLLRLVLRIIDEGIDVLNADETFSEKKDLETCILLSLRILQQALIQQDNFLSEVFNSHAALIVNPLDVLLRGINPRTHRSDYCSNIGRIVGYFCELPRQSLAAARVIFLLSRKSSVAEHLASVFNNDQETSTAITVGFAGALDLPSYEEPPSGKESEWSEPQIRTAIAQTILRTIQQCIEMHKVPSVAHFLLGFDIRRPLNRAALERAGYMGRPKNCLHNCLELLDLSINFPERFSESLAELCYKLVYFLCANSMTSEPVMRYLRNTENFFIRHLVSFQKKLIEPSTHASEILLQRCWFLKSLALELRMCAETNQRSMVKKIVDPLVVDDGRVTADMMQPCRRKLLRILDEIVSTSLPEVRPPTFTHFDPIAINGLLEACHYAENSGGPTLIDISALHDRLALEKMAETADISGHLGDMNDEIREIVKTAVSDNAKSRFQFARKSCMSAWRDVVEVLVCSCPPDLFGGEEKMRFLLEVTTELLTLISESRKVSDSLTAFTEVVLINTMSLNKVLMRAARIGSTSESNGYIPVNAYSGQLLIILRLIISSLQRIPPAKQLARSNIYGALLNVLRIVKGSPKANQPPRSIGERVLDSSSEQLTLQRSLMDILNSYGDNFRELICRELCSGHHVIRMLALSTLDILLFADNTDVWLQHVAQKGYLTHIVESIIQDNHEIQLFARGSQDDKPIYLFSAKMSVLRRMAQSERGARLLLDCGLINKLTEFSSFQNRLVVNSAAPRRKLEPDNDFYHRIYVPLMQLLCAIASAVHSNQDCLSQLQNFLIAHSDVILVILQQRLDNEITEQALLEISYACKVVGMAVSHDDVHQGRIRRLHDTMLSVLPWAIHLRPRRNSLGTLRFELIESLLHSCVNFLVPNIHDRKTCHLLFSPNLLANEPQFGSMPQASGLRLGLLVQSLQDFVAELKSVAEVKRKRSQKLERINEISMLELQELLPEEYQQATLDTALQRGIVKDCIEKEVETLRKQQGLVVSIVEQTLFILWRHLEYFLTQYVPVQDTSLEIFTRGTSTDSGTNVTNEEVENLRASVPNVFSDSYFRKILQVEGIVDTDGDKQKILAALVRRLKTLVRLT
ncbi:nuclear pore complex protein Nup205 [Galendromus occidentalis]|uniref:Nuclear pore complex protein Nup205 n=1 Tax=Galendromus occidentalis TaxID=34638 RepID=A0AAJ6QR93_9ACAR|nr:nuclear pore complex protein Nup205 [Galendromus occidentalis]